MAYKIFYKLKTTYDSETHKKTRLHNLLAKFDFKNEIAPKHRKEINSRISHRILKAYLEIKGLTYNTARTCFISREKHFLDGGDTVVVEIPHFKNYKFNLFVTSEKDCKEEDLFDLDSLNKYILTGAMHK